MPPSHPQQPILHTPAHALRTSGAQTDGMARANALAGVSAQLCASRMVAGARTASAVHHHGAQDTVVFAAAGRGAIVFAGGAERIELAPGDFALIPAWAEHQEVNDGDEEAVWCIVRGGGEPVVVNLEGGWGTS